MTLHLDAAPEDLQVFLSEVEEHLQVLDERLLQLETAATPELLQEMFRAAHTIKGASATIGHSRMAGLTHAVETVLDRMRQGQLTPEDGVADPLFAAVDVLKLLAAEVRTLEETEVDLAGLTGILEALVAESTPATDPNEGLPTIRPTSLKPPIGATHHLLLEFADEAWSSIRAMQVFMELEPLADIQVSRPSRDDVEKQLVRRRIEAWLKTEQSREALLEKLAEIPDTSVMHLRSMDEMDGLIAGPARGGRRASDASLDQLPAAAGSGAEGGGRTGMTTVRVDVAVLDDLLNLVGELVIGQSRLVNLRQGLLRRFGKDRLIAEVGSTTLQLGRVTSELQAVIMKSRMLPIGSVFNRFPRVVRDLSTRQNKVVELVVEGQQTELDRSVIEEIGDPLVHLLRNAIDHGIEPPAERLALGKPETALVRLAAEHAENSIVIVVEDDGRGIDTERVRAKAIEKGIITAEVAARLSEHDALELVFAPGFSTAAQVSDISGRGVGMDIVRTNVEKLGGTVEVQTRLGKGTRFTLRMPLTLAIVQALLVRVEAGVYALPLSCVTETLRVTRSDIHRLKGQEAILLRGQVLPVVRLGQIFGWPPSGNGADDQALVVAVKVGERQVGLAVDALLGEQEVVIKALGGLIGQVPGISSAAILGDGSVALIVDVPSLLQRLSADRIAGAMLDVGELREAGAVQVA